MYYQGGPDLLINIRPCEGVFLRCPFARGNYFLWRYLISAEVLSAGYIAHIRFHPSARGID